MYGDNELDQTYVQTDESTADSANAVDPNDVSNMALQTEEMPSLSEFAAEPSQGAWAPGWYKATVIEGYATKSGFQFNTEDKVSQKGDSRNLIICFSVSPADGGGEPRTMFHQFNYRTDDFTVTKLSAIKELRQRYAGKKGQWAETDLQRSDLAVKQLGQFERAFAGKTKLARTPHGNLAPMNLIGYPMDVHLVMGSKKDSTGTRVETGFNEISEFAQLGERTDKKVVQSKKQGK